MLFESFVRPAGAPEHLDLDDVRGCEYADGDGPLTAMRSGGALGLGIGKERSGI